MACVDHARSPAGQQGSRKGYSPWAPGPFEASLLLRWDKEEVEMRYRKGSKQAGMAMAAMTAALLLGGAPSQERGGALEQAFAWVRSLWETVDVGAHIDPNGLTVSSPQPKSKDSSDEGMHIDPNG